MKGMRIPATLRVPAMMLVATQAHAAEVPGKDAVAAPTEAQAASQRRSGVGDALPETDITVTGHRELENPFADSQAPYKVDRLSGDKFVVPLLDLPKTVTVIPREVIEDQGALSFRDLVRVQPGITLGTGEGGNAYGDRTFIRGFDARNDVYVDGFRDPGVTLREVFSLQQIEVSKGPSGTYGGRGTTGGSVNFVTKAPQKANFAAVNATVGSDSTVRGTVDTNFEASDNLQFRINGLAHRSHVAGRDEVWSKRFGVSVAGAWQPAPNVDVNADYYHLSWDALPDWGMPFDTRSQQPFVAVDRNNWYGVLARDFLKSRVDSGTIRLGWDIAKNIKLSSIGRYSWNLNSYIASAPESPLITDPDPTKWTIAANPKSRNARSKFYGNQTQVRFDFDTGGIGHKLVVGGEISREEVENRPLQQALSETVGAPIVPAVPIRVNLFDPIPNTPWVSASGAPLVPSPSGARTTVSIDSKALFALDTIEITPKLQISAGIRYDNFDMKVNSIAAPTAGNPPPQALLLGRKDEFVNWNAGIVYKPIPSVSLYVSAATSSNPSGEQTDGAAASYGGLTPQNVNLSPEKNQAYEVGVKWQPGGHLMLTAALFRTTKNNARVIPAGGTNTAPLELTGKQRAQGIELSASGNITRAWSVFGGFVLLDTEVLETPNPANLGARFPNQPKTSASLLSTYKISEGLTLGGQASYYSKRYGGNNLSNSAGTVVGGVVAAQPTLPAYWRFDATARVKLNEDIELQINGLNLTDKRYFEALYQSATPFSYQAPGRSVLGTMRVIF